MKYGHFGLVMVGAIGGAMAVVSVFVAVGIKPATFENIALSQSDLSTLIAGFGGAVLGGLISWLLGWQTQIETLKRDEESRISLEKSAVLRVMITTLQISNGIYTIFKAIDEYIIDAAAQGHGNIPLWQKVRASVSMSQPIPSFNPVDFVPLADAQNSDLINRCIMIANRYDSVDSSLREYSRRRMEFQDMAAPYVDHDTNVTMFPPESQVARQAAMLAMELDQLINQIWHFVQHDVQEGRELCADIAKAAGERFKGKGPFVTLQPIPEKPSPDAGGQDQAKMSGGA